MRNRYRAFVFCVLAFVLFLLPVSAVAQNLTGRVEDESGSGLKKVSVVLLDGRNLAVSYALTGNDGSFSVSVPTGKAAKAIKFSCLGYSPEQMQLSDFKNGQAVRLQQHAVELKEVKVKPKGIVQRGDTLDYLVSKFKKDQDRSIADVIARMAGLNVSKDGKITYQGRAINKFYVEGMDLMGGKYSVISENLSADKVKKVQVYEKHQPVKSLKDIDFSEQAALNIVLKDDVKDVWQGTCSMGGGTALQEKASALYDGRLSEMLFSRKVQSVSMYKFNNTGKNIKSEITSHSVFEEYVPTEGSVLSNLSTSVSDLDGERTQFNRTHLVCNSTLFKIGKDSELRTQLTGLYDHTSLNEETQTIYTNVRGDSAITEKRDADSYRSELTGEVLLRINSDKLYLANTLNGYIDFNRSTGTTLLNGRETRENVKPRRRQLTDKLKFVRNMGNGKAISAEGYFSYSYLPGQLLLANGTMQDLNIDALRWGASTDFRHSLWRLDVAYRTRLEGISQKMTTENFLTNQTDTYSEYKLYVEPQLGYKSRTFNVSSGFPVSLLHRSFNGLDKVQLAFEPNVSVGFEPTAKWNFNAYYFHSWSPSDLTGTSDAPTFVDYLTLRRNNGRLRYTPLDYLSGRIEFKDIIHGFFATMRTTYNYMGSVPLYKSRIDPVYSFYESEPTDRYTSNKSFVMEASMGMNLDWLQTTVKLTARSSTTKTDLLVGEYLMPTTMTGRALVADLSFNPVRRLSLKAMSSISYSRRSSSGEVGLPGSSIMYYNHTLNASWTLGKWQLLCNGDYFHSNDKSASDAFFLDAELRYRRKKLDVYLSLRNLLGKNTYEKRYLTSLIRSYDTIRVRPRELMLGFSYGF
ncbi:TonB-dependent receptor [Prevotella dentasini]